MDAPLSLALLPIPILRKAEEDKGAVEIRAAEVELVAKLAVETLLVQAKLAEAAEMPRAQQVLAKPVVAETLLAVVADKPGTNKVEAVKLAEAEVAETLLLLPDNQLNPPLAVLNPGAVETPHLHKAPPSSQPVLLPFLAGLLPLWLALRK